MKVPRGIENDWEVVEVGDTISVSVGDEFVSEVVVMICSEGKTALMTGRVRWETKPV